MHGVLAVAGAEFFDIQFFTSRLAAQDVIVRTTLRADEEHRFRLFFTFGHFSISRVSNLDVL